MHAAALCCVTRGHGSYFLAYRYEKYAYKNWAQFQVLVNHVVPIFCGGSLTIYGGGPTKNGHTSEV